MIYSIVYKYNQILLVVYVKNILDKLKLYKTSKICKQLNCLHENVFIKMN